MSATEVAEVSPLKRLERKDGPLVLRATDQESARVVAVHRADGVIVGAGCLVDGKKILTCRHVVAAALAAPPADMRGQRIPVTLAGVSEQPTSWTTVVDHDHDGPENDLALLEIEDEPRLKVSPVEFASPLRHGGKTYSVLGFPGGDQQGRNATGSLHAADAKGLVQMDRGGSLSVLGGFSGAPVWSPEVNAFVGLVVTELAKHDVSWCIPSRRICEFFPDLRVRFRIPQKDRPVIHDYEADDPNVDLFGSQSSVNARSLKASILEYDDYYDVTVVYECTGSAPRGHFVTFITYPDFEQANQDAYELFAEVKAGDDKITWRAETNFEPVDLFTIAAIADGGETVLALDLTTVKPQLKSSRRRISNQRKG